MAAKPDQRGVGASTLNTLLLYVTSVTWKSTVKATVAQGLLGKAPGEAPAGLWARPPLSKLFVGQNWYECLSYVNDWREAFEGHPRLRCAALDINNLIATRRVTQNIGDYDLIVVLHSALGDDLGAVRRLAAALCARRGALLCLVGNEYDLMPQKIGFLKSTGAQWVGTQLPLSAGRWVYEHAGGTVVLPAPHGLNPAVYRPTPETPRTVDVGFVGNPYPPWLGDESRNRAIWFFRDEGPRLGLKVDIGFGTLPRQDYARRLRGWRAVAGGEAGLPCLERDAQALHAAKLWVKENPQAKAGEVRQKFFTSVAEGVDGRAASSRHFEPMGTKTCQLLVEGFYNGLLKPMQHYIPLKPDLSNAEEAVALLRDDSFVQAMTDRVYEEAMAHHTYHHRVDTLVRAMFGP